MYSQSEHLLESIVHMKFGMMSARDYATGGPLNGLLHMWYPFVTCQILMIRLVPLLQSFFGRRFLLLISTLKAIMERAASPKKQNISRRYPSFMPCKARCFFSCKRHSSRNSESTPQLPTAFFLLTSSWILLSD